MNDVTRILQAIDQGDAGEAERLLPLVYEALRSLAAHRMAGEAAGHTLQPTALVHEAYVRLLGPQQNAPVWNSRGHFFAAAAEAMRRILIERARAKGAQKRGGGYARVDLDPSQISLDALPAELLDLDDAIEHLAARDPHKAQLVKLHIFAGLTLPEAASVLGIAPRTARDHWTYARAWLYERLTD